MLNSCMPVLLQVSREHLTWMKRLLSAQNGQCGLRRKDVIQTKIHFTTCVLNFS